MASYMCSLNWIIICVAFYGRLYVRLSVADYMCGFRWPVAFVALSGESCVWISREDYMSGLLWEIICLDLGRCPLVAWMSRVHVWCTGW